MGGISDTLNGGYDDQKKEWSQGIGTKLDKISDTLGGWYNSEKKEWNEGIDTKMDNIGNKLELDVGGELSSIGRTLVDIESKLGSIAETLLEFNNTYSSGAVVAKLNEATANLTKLDARCSLLAYPVDAYTH